MLMAAHNATRLARTTKPTLLFLVLLSSYMFLLSSGSPDSDALLRFRETLAINDAISSWDPQRNPCNGDGSNWNGVLCLNGTIWGLQLEHMGLAGTIDIDSLASLHSIRTLSLMDNQFKGPMPDVKKLGKLKALYLSNNAFSGEIPDNAFEGMGSLKRVFLAHNQFTGKIPSSLTTLPKLSELRLDGNMFGGQIPEFQQQGLRLVSVASNDLEGPIPESLSTMTPSSFSGNKGLCGPPMAACPPPPPQPVSPPPVATPTPPTAAGSAPPSDKKWRILKILIIVILVLLVLALALLLLIFFYKKRSEGSLARTVSNTSSKAMSYASSREQGGQAAVAVGGGAARRVDHGKLIFLRDDVEKFDLQDMLRASAEVLGSGTFGASYKAVVGGQAMVVKRYRHMNKVGREEFHEHMRRLGRLKHPNLLPLVAHYYRREEKLLVAEYMENGSLVSHLLGNHSLEEEGLDWHTRLKIIKGVARGLAYLYNELPLSTPHGHLKSSNVLLDDNFEPLLTDYALRPVINPENAHTLMMAYKSPEYAQHGRTSNKTDIWSFGILILEILTGKFPENYLTAGYNSDADLATWVNNKVKEKKTSDVFDKEMMGTKNSKSVMLNLLKIGLSCCEEDVDRRMDIKEVVEKIEELKEGDGEEFYGSSEQRRSFSIRGSDDHFSSPADDR